MRQCLATSLISFVHFLEYLCYNMFVIQVGKCVSIPLQEIYLTPCCKIKIYENPAMSFDRRGVMAYPATDLKLSSLLNKSV